MSALLAVSCSKSPSGAEAKETSTVDQIARDKYWSKDSPEDFNAAMALLKKPAPPLNLTDWHGKAVTASDMKGKIVLIDFWATWCGPCLAQIPHANGLAKKYADKGVIVFGACCNQGADEMDKTAVDHNMEYPTAKLNEKDPDGWHVVFWPTYAVLDREGKLRAVGLDPEYVDKLIDALLVEQPATGVH